FHAIFWGFRSGIYFFTSALRGMCAGGSALTEKFAKSGKEPAEKPENRFPFLLKLGIIQKSAGRQLRLSALDSKAKKLYITGGI
ncbi:MAG: hypothetical protein LUD18_01405, partial [Lachnospiraceae bacterium]|nr:hypothetical protein [Lachnospiraceae bacterium]